MPAYRNGTFLPGQVLDDVDLNTLKSDVVEDSAARVAALRSNVVLLSARGTANGVAPLDATGKVPSSLLPVVTAGTTDQVARDAATAAQATANAALPASLRGVANGVAPLDATGKVPSSLLPAAVTGTTDQVARDSAASAQMLAQSNEAALTLKAPLASPTFTGVPRAPTAALETNSTQIASTAFVRAALDALNTTPGTAPNYILPVAAPGVLGGIKPGSGITVAADGTASVAAPTPPYVLQPATAAILGGLKLGTGLSADANGVVSVVGTGDASTSQTITAAGTYTIAVTDIAVSIQSGVTGTVALVLAAGRPLYRDVRLVDERTANTVTRITLQGTGETILGETFYDLINADGGWRSATLSRFPSGYAVF